MGAENLTVWEPIPMKLKRIHAKYNSNKALEQNDYSALLKADVFDSFEKKFEEAFYLMQVELQVIVDKSKN